MLRSLYSAKYYGHLQIIFEFNRHVFAIVRIDRNLRLDISILLDQLDCVSVVHMGIIVHCAHVCPPRWPQTQAVMHSPKQQAHSTEWHQWRQPSSGGPTAQKCARVIELARMHNELESENYRTEDVDSDVLCVNHRCNVHCISTRWRVSCVKASRSRRRCVVSRLFFFTVCCFRVSDAPNDHIELWVTYILFVFVSCCRRGFSLC